MTQEAETPSERAWETLTEQLTPKRVKDREQRIMLLKELEPSYEWIESFGQFVDQWLREQNEAKAISREALETFVKSHFDLLGKEAVEIFTHNLYHTESVDLDIVSFVIGQGVARATVCNRLELRHVLSFLRVPPIDLGLFSALLEMLTNDKERALAFAEKFLSWLCQNPEAELCGSVEEKKDFLQAVHCWREGKKGEIWQLWDWRCGWLGRTKTAFGENLFAFLCHSEKELVSNLSMVDLPLTANYIFSDSAFFADPQFLLETYAKLPCSCVVPSQEDSSALPVWNGSVLAPCLLQQLPACLANMLASGIDEGIVRTWGKKFAKAILIREDGVLLTFPFTRHVLLDYLNGTQPGHEAYRLFLESINAALENNQECRNAYLSYMDVFFQNPSEESLRKAFKSYQQIGNLQEIPGSSALSDLITFLCILPDEDIALRGKSLVRKYEYIWAVKNKTYGPVNFTRTIPYYAHMSIAGLYYSTGAAQSVDEWVKTYRRLVPPAENYFLRTIEDMVSVELHQRITFHLSVGLAISDLLINDAHVDEALELLMCIAKSTVQISLYLNHVFVSDYRRLFTLSAVRAYKFAKHESGEAAKGIVELLPFLTMTGCLPLLALDLVDCLLANEEQKEVLTENDDIKAFAKKALAEAYEYVRHEHWDEQEKRTLQERCAAQRRFFPT